MARIHGIPAWKLMLGLPIFLLEVLTSRRFVDGVLRFSDSLSAKRRSEMVKVAVARDKFFARRRKQFSIVGSCVICAKATPSWASRSFASRLCRYHQRLEKLLQVS